MGVHIEHWHSFVIGGELLVSMNKPKGKFYIDARSHLIGSGIRGSYEGETMDLLSNLKLNDGLIVNIGANIGFYAIQLANSFPGKKILAIEPNPEAYSLLLKNININRCTDTIEAVNVCVGNNKGKVPCSIIPGKSEYSSISGIIHDAVEHEKQIVIEVESKLLSDIVLDKKVSLIFMDVEGAEKLILDGSNDLINRDKPIIVCECNDPLLQKFNSSSFDLVNKLENLNFKVTNANKYASNIVHPFNGNIIAKPL